MRLIEIVLSVVLFSFFSMIAVSECKPVSELHRSELMRRASYERDKFIVSSFRNVCSDKTKTNEDIQNWQKMCMAAFNPEFISVKQERSCIKAIWKTEDGVRTVIAKSVSEKEENNEVW